MILNQLFENTTLVSEAVEDRTSYQVAKALFDRGVKYDPARENDLIKAIGLVLVKELNMSPGMARGVMNDEDFLGDTLGELRHMEQGVTEGSLNEFAPGNGGDESGRWYTDSELADIIGDDWFEDFDVSNDGFNMDAHGEKAKKNLVGYANSWFDDRGYNVNVLGVENNEVDHDLQWYVVGSFHNPNFADKNIDEGSQRVDSLVTDALKIMRGSDLKDAVQALKTVLGDREYNSRRGHYNFYVRQLMDMYSKQGVAEAGPYGSRNPDTMSSNEYDRYQQDQMDLSKRDFKRREHEAEWEQEKAYSDKLAARDAGTWYVRINGKIVKDKQGNAYTFQGKAAANKAALTMQAKPFNKGKQFMLTTNPNDTVAESVTEATKPAQKKQQVSENRYIPKHKRW